MKIVLLALITLIFCKMATAQTDTLASGVYNISKKGGGSTTDLSVFRTHQSVLPPGKTNHSPKALMDTEELIVVKEGQLTVMINDTSQVLGAGSLVLIQAGDLQSFRNASGTPVTYYVLSFRSKLPVNVQRGKDAGGSLMKDWNALTVKKTAKGESRPVFDRPTAMFARFEVHATALNSGEDSHAAHTHRAEEIMLVMKGNVTAHIAGKDYPAGPGDLILVTPNVLHHVTNTGTEQCWYYAVKWFNQAVPDTSRQ